MRHVLGIDAGGTKTCALIADETGRVVGSGRGAGANLKTHGELEVEKVLHDVIEQAEQESGVTPDAVAVGIAGADRPNDRSLILGVLRRIGFKKNVLVTNDARVAFVAGSPLRVGLALVCGTGSIAWGRNATGATARAGGWGWHVGDEGSGFWIGERAIRAVLRQADGRGPATALTERLFAHFRVEGIDGLHAAVYDGEYPRRSVAIFAARVEEAARAGDPVAREILGSAAAELILAARTVVERLSLESGPYDIVLSGGTFSALPGLRRRVEETLASPRGNVLVLDTEPALGAVRLALEELQAGAS